MAKYNIDSAYGIYRYFKPPFHKSLLALGDNVLSLIPLSLNSREDLRITKHSIESFDHEKVNLYLFNPKAITTDQVYLYLHGGGFVFKGYKSHYNLCERFALEGQCKVIYVDYRLAPKYPYPIPLEDCYAAYRWILRNAKLLGIDPDKIIVGGDSAGGCLAADITIRAIEKNYVVPSQLMLYYPVLDKRCVTPSMKKFTDTPAWNSKLNQKMWQMYLQGKSYTSPNERTDVTRFPATFVETAEYDCLHDEAIEFYHKLQSAGIPVELNETKRTMHGFDIRDCSITEQAIQKRIEMIRRSER